MTIEPAAMTTLSPTLTPGKIIAPTPIKTFEPIYIGDRNDLLEAFSKTFE